MTSTFDKDNEEFPICPDCGKRHEPLPDNIVLSTHDLAKIHKDLHKILMFTQEKRIPLTILAGMIATFQAELMDELMMRKREAEREIATQAMKPFIVELEKFLKGSPDHGGLQEETGRTESKEQSSTGNSSTSSTSDSTGSGSKKGNGTILH